MNNVLLRKRFPRPGRLAAVFSLLLVVLAFAAPQRVAHAQFGGLGPCDGFGVKFDPLAGGFTVYISYDKDCDGVGDGADNCPHIYNPDQKKSRTGVNYGDACVPENGDRITARSSEVAIYRQPGGAAQFYSQDGVRLGEMSAAGLFADDPTLRVKQIAGWTYEVSYVNAAGQTRTTRFKASGINFGISDIASVVVEPASLEMKPGETRQFTARGFHATGIELWFVPRWNVTGGTVSTSGLYTAGSTPGDYTVTACRVGDVCGVAMVKIVP